VERPHCGTKHFADGAVETRIGVAVGGYEDESGGGGGGGGRLMSAMSFLGAPSPSPMPSRRPSSKSSRSSGSTVRARTWPLGNTDEVLGHFMNHD